MNTKNKLFGLTTAVKQPNQTLRHYASPTELGDIKTSCESGEDHTLINEYLSSVQLTQSSHLLTQCLDVQMALSLSPSRLH